MRAPGARVVAVHDGARARADLLQDPAVSVMEDPGDDFGAAHIIVMGITKRRVDWLCELARRQIVKLPEPPTASRETDKPRM